MGYERKIDPPAQVLRCCEACGQPIDNEEKLLAIDGLKIAGTALIFGDDVRVVFRGAIILMRMLVLRGRVSNEAFLIAVNSDAEKSTANTYVHYLRKALAELHAPLQIQTIYGWGYELRRADGSAVTKSAQASDRAWVSDN